MTVLDKTPETRSEEIAARLMGSAEVLKTYPREAPRFGRDIAGFNSWLGATTSSVALNADFDQWSEDDGRAA